jgi:zinc protease
MFAGSKHVGGQFDELLESIGATNVNGTTSWDRTNYFETIPREYLELVLWIESDRMGFLLDAIDQNALDTQRDVVKNERRQSFENAPYGPSSLTLMDTLFPEGHPYHGAVIGSMADLSAATFADVRSFYQNYYAPSNATLALAGDIDVRQARAWIDRYFSTLRNVPKPQSGATRALAIPKSQRLEIGEPVKVPRVAFGWVTPGAYKPQSEALEVASELLAGGKASRLYRSLVVEKKLAADVSADADGNALGTLFTVEAFAATGAPLPRLEDALVAEVASFSKLPPTDDELKRAKSRILLSVTRELQALNGHGGEAGRLGQLQRFNHYFGNPSAIEPWYQRIWAVKAEDVSAACAQWLAADHRVTVVTQAKERGQSR